MRKVVKTSAVVVAALAAIVVALFVLRAGHTADSKSQGEPESAAPVARKTPIALGKPVEEVGEPAEDIGAIDLPLAAERAEQLETLKEKWLELFGETAGERGPASRMEERYALAEESAEVLLCSAEVVELIEFLDEKKIYNTVEIAVGQLFDSPQAEKARAALLELPEDLLIYSYSYKEHWSLKAGKGCPADQFAAFHEALACVRCAQEALFGHNRALTRTDTSAAIASTLETLQEGIESRSARSALRDQMGEIPRDADFESIMRLFLHEGGEPHSVGHTDRVVLADHHSKVGMGRCCRGGQLCHGCAGCVQSRSGWTRCRRRDGEGSIGGN